MLKRSDWLSPKFIEVNITGKFVMTHSFDPNFNNTQGTCSRKKF